MCARVMVISAYATLDRLAFDACLQTSRGGECTYLIPMHWRAPLLKVHIYVSSSFASGPSQRFGLKDPPSGPQIWGSVFIVYADIPTIVYPVLIMRGFVEASEENRPTPGGTTLPSTMNGWGRLGTIRGSKPGAAIPTRRASVIQAR